MTVRTFTTNEKIIVAAADTKPTGVPVGSEIWEWDTNKSYRTYDGTNWDECENITDELDCLYITL